MERQRLPELERLVIDAAARATGMSWWEVFATRDSAFEAIADGAADRIERSRV